LRNLAPIVVTVAKTQQSLDIFVSPANNLCAGILQALADKTFLLPYCTYLCCNLQIKRELNLEIL